MPFKSFIFIVLFLFLNNALSSLFFKQSFNNALQVIYFYCINISISAVFNSVP